MDLKRRIGRGLPEYEERVREAQKARECARGERRRQPRKIKPYHYRITLPDGSVLLMDEIRTFWRADACPQAAFTTC
jgi:hypothetical protein